MSSAPLPVLLAQPEVDEHVIITGYWIFRGGLKVDCGTAGPQASGFALKEGYVYVCADVSIAEISVRLNADRANEPEFEYDPTWFDAGPCKEMPGRVHYLFRAGMTDGEYAEARQKLERRDSERREKQEATRA